jgi:microcystin-dependent protein
MSAPYIGEIRMFAGNFAPVDWALCNGQIMAIDQNAALFQLIGTTYGGDGQTNFALPNLQGRIPIHQGDAGGFAYTIGQSAGAESVTLNVNQIPSHTHTLPSSSVAGTSSSPAASIPAAWGSNQYVTDGARVTMAAAVGSSGSSLPHDNMGPYLVVNFIIALFGIFPSQN